jgi:penicillin-binding protein 2
MWGVVHEWGTGYRAKIQGFDICGKTGTAQVVGASVGVKNEEELPLEQRDHAWFVGFAPAPNPEVVFAILVEHGGHGGEAAVPIAKAVFEAYLAEKQKTAPRTNPSKEVALGPAGAAPRLF